MLEYQRAGTWSDGSGGAGEPSRAGLSEDMFHTAIDGLLRVCLLVGYQKLSIWDMERLQSPFCE